MRHPKQIRTDVDCRAARPKFDKGARSPAKISDVTGGGLYVIKIVEGKMLRKHLRSDPRYAK